VLSGAVIGIVILAILVTVTVKGWWPYLWREWLTSVDHKRIGIMYVVLGLIMLLRGFSDAIMMRTQQAIAVGSAQGYLHPRFRHDRYSADRYTRCRAPVWLAVSPQRNHQRDHDLHDAPSTGGSGGRLYRRSLQLQSVS
jgi:hypothetical protein